MIITIILAFVFHLLKQKDMQICFTFSLQKFKFGEFNSQPEIVGLFVYLDGQKFPTIGFL